MTAFYLMVSVIACTKRLMVYFIKLAADKCVSAPRDVTCYWGRIDLSTWELLRGRDLGIPIFCFYSFFVAESCRLTHHRTGWANVVKWHQCCSFPEVLLMALRFARLSIKCKHCAACWSQPRQPEKSLNSDGASAKHNHQTAQTDQPQRVLIVLRRH